MACCPVLTLGANMLSAYSYDFLDRFIESNAVGFRRKLPAYSRRSSCRERAAIVSFGPAGALLERLRMSKLFPTSGNVRSITHIHGKTPARNAGNDRDHRLSLPIRRTNLQRNSLDFGWTRRVRPPQNRFRRALDATRS